MSSALALESFDFDPFEQDISNPTQGVQSLLAPQHARPPYLLQGAAVGVYLLVLAGGALFSARPMPPVEEQPLELVMLPPAAAEEQPAPPPEVPPLPVAEEMPPPEEVLAPPPPVAETPAVAPVEPPKAPPPKPQPKPKAVEHKPTPQPHSTLAGAPRTGQADAPPNALASGYANQVHARIAAAAASLIARAGHQTGRVAYRIVISPSGAVVSQSITPSGNTVVDALATQALHTSFPASGMPANVSLSGAIVVR